MSEIVCGVVGGLCVGLVFTLVMCSAPRARCRGIRDCAWGCVRPACELWMARAATLLMFSPPSSRCRGIRDCAWGCVTPVCGVWVARVVTLVMFSAPLGRGRSVRDYVQGYVRPACELWMSRVVSPRYVFGTLGTKTGRVRLRVGLSEACVRGVGVACSDLAYVFAAFFTRLGCSRLRVERLAARVQGRCLPSLCVRHPRHDAGAFEIVCRVV